MIILKAKIRKEEGKNVKKLREQGLVPAVLYGPKLKNVNLEVNAREFEKVYKEAGESSLVSLEADKEKYLALINDVKVDPVSDALVHIDFYQPNLNEEISVTVPLTFEGEAPAARDLNGTLVRNIQELEVRSLPQNLPHEIRVNISNLLTFDDAILVKDLNLSKDVTISRELGDLVAKVVPPEKVEEELEKPVEEKVEEVEKVETKKPEKEEEEEPAKK